MMAKKKPQESDGDSIRPKHRAVMEFTISMLRVLPRDTPLPMTRNDFFYETRILVHAIAFWDGILNGDDDKQFRELADDRDSLEDPKFLDHGRPLCEYVAHALGLLVERLRTAFPAVAPSLPRYGTIPEMSGVCGESYAELVLKLGELRWHWMDKAAPYKQVGQEITPVFSKDELDTWTYCRRLAECVADELPWFRQNRNMQEPDCERLLNLLAVEVRRVRPKTPRKNKSRNAALVAYAKKRIKAGDTYQQISAKWNIENSAGTSGDSVRKAVERADQN